MPHEMLDVECKLSDEDRLIYSKQLAETVLKKRNSENSLKTISSQLKAEVQRHDADISNISEKLSSGVEYRKIECFVVMDYDKKIKIYHRCDTHEIVKTDILTEKDLQQELNL